jgi:hypothetical protein
VHLQNAQLYTFGAIANGIVVSMGSRSFLGERDARTNPAGPSSLTGFTYNTWWITITLASFGIVSSLIMKHLSNVAKVFNSAAGMVVVTFFSRAFLGTKVTLSFFLAASVIVASLFLFYLSGPEERSGGNPGLGPTVEKKNVAEKNEKSQTRASHSRKGSVAFDVFVDQTNETKQLL